jgi:signal transduction histidine kinase
MAASSPLIEVPPPFQDSWWFRGLVAFVVLAIGWLSLRLYIHRRLAVQRVAFEREQAVLTERMRIAGDMHDDLGAGLSALKLRSEMALRTEKDPVKREQLGALASTAGELIGSMRQIIWTMNRDQAGLEDLVVYVTSYARGYCAENRLELDVDAPGPWPAITLSTEQRRNVFLVVKEALHNILKHAQARQVGLHLAIGNGNLMVKVMDDGVGMRNEASRTGGNGLRNMERRAAALGGSLSVEEGAGTVLCLAVPLVHAGN